jgi:hypothetical protein
VTPSFRGQAPGLLRFGGLVEAWLSRSTRRRKDAEHQTAVLTGVSRETIWLVRVSDEEHPIPRIAKELGGVAAGTLSNRVGAKRGRSTTRLG